MIGGIVQVRFPRSAGAIHSSHQGEVLGVSPELRGVSDEHEKGKFDSNTFLPGLRLASLNARWSLFQSIIGFAAFADNSSYQCGRYG